MRKTNLFGKKNKKINLISVIFIIFVLELIGYFLISNYEQKRIDALEATQTNLQVAINNALASHDDVTYFGIDEMILSLPNTFNEYAVTNEIEFVRSLSGIRSASNFVLAYTMNVALPFNYTFATTIKAVSINISMNIDDAADLLTFMDNLTDLERFYYISEVNVTSYNDGSASISMTMYTFYNNVIL